MFSSYNLLLLSIIKAYRPKILCIPIIPQQLAAGPA
jgi:hypothetical protein